MPDVFGDYGRYYDLLYADKDYAAEAKYVAHLLKRFAEQPKSILEFGCGTGKHARLLAEMGCDVTGIERSAEMRDVGCEMRDAENGKGSFRCLQGDIRSTRVNGMFDAVISLFHVVSYLTTNEDVQAVFANAARHLTAGGVFLFDVWYGPAVLCMRPSVRVKRMGSHETQLLRIAEPNLDVNANRVDVDYTILITDTATGDVRQLQETHPMRYYFAPELELLAEGSGMEIICSEEWITERPPSEATWGVCFVARKRGEDSTC